jgi:hypothetical protein
MQFQRKSRISLRGFLTLNDKAHLQIRMGGSAAVADIEFK